MSACHSTIIKQTSNKNEYLLAFNTGPRYHAIGIVFSSSNLLSCYRYSSCSESLEKYHWSEHPVTDGHGTVTYSEVGPPEADIIIPGTV